MHSSARSIARASKHGTLEADAARRPDASAPRCVEAAPRSPATPPLLLLAGLAFVGHMVVAGYDGYFRDELYYIADGRHLQAGYVDQPLLMGWLAALLRLVAGDGLVAIHVIPALACALLVVLTGLMARELGGGRVAQSVAAVAALVCLAFMATGSLFSMDALDQLWWSLVGLVLLRLLRRDEPRLWLLVGLVVAVALLTKLTVLFFCLALFLALLVTPERRYLCTRWPYMAAAIASLGLLPYLLWNAVNGWPTWQFWHHYAGVGTSALAFFAAQIGQMNPIAFPLALAGLVWYFQHSGARYRLLGWTVVFVGLILVLLHLKPYFLAPVYPILFAAGAVWLEALRARPGLSWIRPVYIALLVLAGIVLAPDVMPVLSPATTVRIYGPIQQVLADRLGWDSLTQTVQRVYAALPPAQRSRACVVTSNYGEAGALQQLSRPGGLPPVISGHNNYYLWGPGSCTGQVLITVGYSRNDVQHQRALYPHIRLAAIHRCKYCVSFEQTLPIYVLSGAARPVFPRLWSAVKQYG